MINRLKAILGAENVLENEKLNNHTTFRVGGASKALLAVNSVEELKTVLAVLKSAGEKFFLLGNGSNLLVSDSGYDGYVIRLLGAFEDLRAEGKSVVAGSGAMLSKVCGFARDNDLAGLEFAFGIPGTVGGAMVMNAGAYGGEMKDVVKSVELMDFDGNLYNLSCEEMNFGYRDSIIKHKDYIVLKTVFELNEGIKEEITAKMDEVMQKRRDKQPLEHPSAGSTFKRPEGAFAGKLIQDSGLAGARIGGASVSTKHCGFIVNDMGGTATDIDRLMKLVADKVKNDSGFVLVPEVIRVGRFEQQ